MQTRTTFLAAAASAVVLAAAGIGLADTADVVNDSPSPTPTATASATPTPDARADGLRERRLVAAGAAGSVQYRFTDVLTIASVDPAPGWTAEIEQPRGAEIEVVFTNGVRRIDVEVEIEDGEPRERVRERADDDRMPGDADDQRGDDSRGDDWRGDDDGRHVGDDDPANHEARDDRVGGDDGPGHDVGDDHGGDRDRYGDDDRSGRRGGGDDRDDDRSGRGGGDDRDDDRSGHGGGDDHDDDRSGRDHPEDD